MKITNRQFGVLADGSAVTCWTMTNDAGLQAEILDYGVTIRAIVVPDRCGNPVDVALGYDTLEEYVTNDGYLGATIGRFANRIAKGMFTLNGVDYQVAVNDGPNHLHGGICGFDKRIWAAEPQTDGIRFSLTSPDGEEGYPGTLQVQVTVSWKGNGLQLAYHAETDKDTVINLSNHNYYNLDGAGTIYDHLVTLRAEQFNQNDNDCLPTGELVPVDGTVMDFRTPRAIGDGVDSDEICVTCSGGYDSNYVLCGSPAAIAKSEKSGIVMTVTTDQPGIQLYSGNFLTKRKGKNGATYERRSGFCLETQHYPDAIHHPEWPTCILRTGEVFESTTTYTFSVE